MKLSRTEIRRIIEEAYSTGIPFKNPIDQSDSMIAKRYPQYVDKLKSVSKFSSSQGESLKQSLDPNRPSDPAIAYKAINDCRNGLCQSQIDNRVDRFFNDDPYAFSGAMSQGGMSLSNIGEEFFYFFDDLLYDINGSPLPMTDDDIEELKRRYTKAVSNPKYIRLGYIS